MTIEDRREGQVVAMNDGNGNGDSRVTARHENPTSEDSIASSEEDGVEVRDLGIITALSEPDTVITEAGLARLFGRCSNSVKRAVKRDELPPPARLFGKPMWTAGVIVEHLQQRQKEAAEEAERQKKKITELEP